MIVRSFLTWFENACVGERIEAAHAMAQTFLSGQLGADSVADAEAALTLILDDPSPQVRRTLAWEMASAPEAPRHVIVALAHDQSEVSALVLARSPQLRDPDLVDCAAIGDTLTQTAIALRPEISAPVAAALAEVASHEALIVLLRNPGADIAPQSFIRMAERHGAQADLREALNQRDDLPAVARQMLIVALSQDLLAFTAKTGWMTAHRSERSIHETREAATISLASEAHDLDDLVEHLRQSGQLTPALLLRGLLCGETALFGASLAALAGLEPKRVAGIVAARGLGALSAAYLRAGLPRTYLPAFLAALRAIRERKAVPQGQEVRLDRAIIQSTLAASLEGNEDETRSLLALLRRFDAEAARMDARETVARIKAEPEALMLDTGVLAMEATPEALAGEADGAAAEIGRVDIDLDAFAAELTLDSPEVAETTLFALPRVVERLKNLEPLRVIEHADKSLDESFFANWELRKNAA